MAEKSRVNEVAVSAGPEEPELEVELLELDALLELPAFELELEFELLPQADTARTAVRARASTPALRVTNDNSTSPP